MLESNQKLLPLLKIIKKEIVMTCGTKSINVYPLSSTRVLGDICWYLIFPDGFTTSLWGTGNIVKGDLVLLVADQQTYKVANVTVDERWHSLRLIRPPEEDLPPDYSDVVS